MAGPDRGYCHHVLPAGMLAWTRSCTRRIIFGYLLPITISELNPRTQAGWSSTTTPLLLLRGTYTTITRLLLCCQGITIHICSRYESTHVSCEGKGAREPDPAFLGDGSSKRKIPGACAYPALSTVSPLNHNMLYLLHIPSVMLFGPLLAAPVSPVSCLRLCPVCAAQLPQYSTFPVSTFPLGFHP